MRRNAAIACLVLALVGGGCSSDEEPVRIGMLADCAGLFAQSRELSLAAVSLPLVERGARVADGGIAAGVEGASVAGRDVELLPECTEFTYVHRLIAATRRLVEERHADVVIGPIGTPESFVFRDLAARYPDVTFVHGVSAAQEVTLRDAPDNLFRFTADGAQATAGLGAYAYRDLGWRTAVVVGEQYADDWEGAAGFVAEFCALGGNVIERDWFSLFMPDPSAAARRHAATADGVLLLTEYTPPAPYLAAYGQAADRLPDELLVGGAWFSDITGFQSPGVDLTGVVRGGYIPLAPGSATMDAYADSFEQAFPDLGALASNPLAVPRYAAMSALVQALETTGGELGDGQAAFREALRTSEPDVPFGEVELDTNRQMTGQAYLERAARAAGGSVVMEPVRTVDGVEQTYDGIFAPTGAAPSVADPACVRRTPPPWAR